MNLDKLVKTFIIIGIIIISFSFVFFYVVRPVINARKLEDCLRTIGGAYRLDDEVATKDECFKKYPQL